MLSLNSSSSGSVILPSAQPLGLVPFFVPLEEELRDNILLDLLGVNIEEVADLLSKIITWGMKLAGIGIPYHTQTAPTNFKTS